MSGELIADNTKLEARTINVEGLVAAVDGGQIVLNVGGKAGLEGRRSAQRGARDARRSKIHRPAR